MPCKRKIRMDDFRQKDMMLAFLQDNMEQFAMDAAAGKGETIETLAGMMNVDSKTLGKDLQQNFAYIFEK